jgi:hypothetical protein
MDPDFFEGVYFGALALQFTHPAIVKERDTGLECTKIWYLFSPLFRGADN